MNWFSKLKGGLSKSSSKLSNGITGIFTKRKLDAESLEQLEELLIEADMGAKLASELVEGLRKQRVEKDIAPEEVRALLAAKIAEILQPVAQPYMPDATRKPEIVLVVGVNGNGKTTTIGKLASKLKVEGKTVMLAAADTFRAAAVEQLQVWGERNGVRVVTGEHQADPASVAFKAVELAREVQVDVLLIDTAGRLQNKTNLMAELQKIAKVMKKIDATAPHRVIQVLDATTGQNAINQVQVFQDMMKVDGLVITKLDGTAKGGIVVALARQFGIPIHAVGVGEGIEDLNPFDAAEFSRHLLDIA